MPTSSLTRQLPALAGSALALGAEVRQQGAAVTVTLSAPGASRSYGLRLDDQQDVARFFARLAEDHGTHAPGVLSPATTPGEVQLLLADSVAPEIEYGYGDPSVIRVPAPGGGWRYVLAVTSNDALDAFPILAADHLSDWRLQGFVFPRGRAPDWTVQGPGADFWAPEIHAVGDEFWACFAARARSGELAIGIARAADPTGPFAGSHAPLIAGGVIDPHIFSGADGRRILFWKEDSNAVWPDLLLQAIGRDASLIARLYGGAPQRRLAAVLALLEPWIRDQPPMHRFVLQQPLIEATVDDLPGFKARLAALGEHGLLDRPTIAAIVQALRTPVFAQELSADGQALVGPRSVVLENDQPWEGHLIEGVWVHVHGGRCYMFYSANDFSTPAYGIGVAVADDPLGPYAKQPGPLLQSNPDWSAPGHPSVAPGPDGRPHLFFHAYLGGRSGYKVPRALLTAPLEFQDGGVRLGRSPHLL